MLALSGIVLHIYSQHIHIEFALPSILSPFWNNQQQFCLLLQIEINSALLILPIAGLDEILAVTFYIYFNNLSFFVSTFDANGKIKKLHSYIIDVHGM